MKLVGLLFGVLAALVVLGGGGDARADDSSIFPTRVVSVGKEAAVASAEPVVRKLEGTELRAALDALRDSPLKELPLVDGKGVDNYVESLRLKAGHVRVGGRIVDFVVGVKGDNAIVRKLLRDPKSVSDEELGRLSGTLVARTRIASADFEIRGSLSVGGDVGVDADVIAPVFVTNELVGAASAGARIANDDASAYASASLTFPKERRWGPFTRKVAVVAIRVEAGADKGVELSVAASATIAYEDRLAEVGARAQYSSRHGTVRADGIVLVELTKNLSVGLSFGVGTDAEARLLSHVRVRF